MSQETLQMSRKERRREAVMVRVAAGELLLKQAVALMGVSDRQAVRIKAGYLRRGASALMHGSRGMPSNRRLGEDFKQKVLDIYRERYADFGPTLACEKMLEYENIDVARETLRRWLIGAGLWRVGQKERVHRTRRERRRHFGEMLQIDGSDHLWFEDRAPRAILMVLVDDATGRFMLHMAEQETTHAALWLLRKWTRAHGVPASIYADRRTVYFTDAFVHEFERRNDPAVFTDFMKVTDRLNIEMIPAYSPQAKGRVERVNGTLQDRLVKELRLLGISTIAAANAMLDDFADELNARFARPAAGEADAHRIAPRGKDEWQYYFSTEETRTVHNDNTVVVKGRHWQILAQPGAPPPGSRVILRRPLDAPAYWVWRERRLRTKPIEPPRPQGPRVTVKDAPSHAGASPRTPGI